MSNLEFPRRNIFDPSDLDRAIYEALDELYITISRDGAVNFDSLVDDPKMRGSIRRVAMNVAWPKPNRHAPAVTTDEKYLVLYELHKIFKRYLNKEAMEVITKPAPLLIGVGTDTEQKNDFIGKEGSQDGQGTEGTERELGRVGRDGVATEDTDDHR